MNARLRAVLASRFFLLPAAFALVAGAWNLYIARHDGGLVRGRVITAEGAPVAGATVRMMEQNFTTNSARGSTVTRADGSFEFADNRSHNIQLHAEKDGVGRSDQRVVRLYFRAQNVTLDTPLMIQPAARK